MKFIKNIKFNQNIDLFIHDCKIFLILKFFDKYVLLKNDIGEFDFLKFDYSNFDYNCILKKIYDLIGINIDINKECYLIENSNDTNYIILTASINSVDLQQLKEIKDYLVIDKKEMEKHYKNEDYYEAIRKFDSKDKPIELIIFLIIPIGLIVSIVFFVINAINGKIIFELMIFFICIIVLLISGLFSFFKK